MTGTGASPEVLLVVPTLGRRNDLLRLTLQSIRDQVVSSEVAVVSPSHNVGLAALCQEFEAELLPDPGSLPGAINYGIEQRLSSHAYVGWLNDDDLLEPGSLAATTSTLKANPEAVVAFGSCRYIDEYGQHLWVSRAGTWAPRILHWGPDLIPQPGMLVKACAWREVGGLDTSYRLAFDLDLLLRVKQLGRLVDTGTIVSSFRWHSDSLTVDNRGTNLAESERAKRAALSPFARRIAWLWEPPVRWATKMAVKEVNRRAARLSAG